MEQLPTFQFGILWQTLVVDHSRLLQTPSNDSFDIFLWNWGNNVFHQDLEKKDAASMYFNYTAAVIIDHAVSMQQIEWHWSTEGGCA